MILAVVVFGTLGLGAMNVWFGTLNQDEGWYLYAARAVSLGRLPYIDFFFTQGPSLPFVYGLLAPLWTSSGLLGGRVLSALLGLGASAITGVLAARLTPNPSRRFHAGLTAFALLGVNVYHSYFTSIPKTYALASLLLMAGMFLLWRVRDRGWVSMLSAAGAGGLTAGATGARFSLAVCAAVVALSLLARRRRYGHAWVAYCLGGMAGAAGLYGFALAGDFEALRFSLAFHGQRAGGEGMKGVLLAAGSIARSVQGYFVLCAMTVCLILARLAGWRPEPSISAAPAVPRPALDTRLSLLVFALAAVLHLISPFPYDDYQVPIFPLLAAAAAAEFWRLIPGRDRDSKNHDGMPEMAVLAGVVLVIFMAAGASPRTQDWFVYGQDRFWVRHKPSSDLAVLREAGDWIRERTSPGEQVLTQDVYLAVEADRPLPEGLEMGPFSLFADLDDEKARRFHVLNPRLFREMIERSPAPVAALSGYGFALAAPGMTPLEEQTRRDLVQTLRRHYRPAKEIPDFGQQYTEATLFLRNGTEE